MIDLNPNFQLTEQQVFSVVKLKFFLLFIFNSAQRN